MEPKLIRPECRECLSWDFRKQVCLRIMHGMTCVFGELPHPGAWVKTPVGLADQVIYKKIADNYAAKASDTQVAGDHYKKMGVEPWAVVDTWPLEQRIGYYRGGALKYIMRMGAKDVSAQEIAKGKHYMEKLLEVLEAAK